MIYLCLAVTQNMRQHYRLYVFQPPNHPMGRYSQDHWKSVHNMDRRKQFSVTSYELFSLGQYFKITYLDYEKQTACFTFKIIS